MLIHFNCYSLATGFIFPAYASPLAAVRMRSQSAIGRAGLVRTTAACRLPARQPLEPRPLFEYYLVNREDSILSFKSLPQETIHFAICEVDEELGPEGRRSFHHDQVLKLIGSCQLRTDNASYVGRTGPLESCPLLEVPGIRPRCLVLGCARSVEAASKR